MFWEVHCAKLWTPPWQAIAFASSSPALTAIIARRYRYGKPWWASRTWTSGRFKMPRKHPAKRQPAAGHQALPWSRRHLCPNARPGQLLRLQAPRPRHPGSLRRGMSSAPCIVTLASHAEEGPPPVAKVAFPGTAATTGRKKDRAAAPEAASSSCPATTAAGPTTGDVLGTNANNAPVFVKAAPPTTPDARPTANVAQEIRQHATVAITFSLAWWHGRQPRMRPSSRGEYGRLRAKASFPPMRRIGGARRPGVAAAGGMHRREEQPRLDRPSSTRRASASSKPRSHSPVPTLLIHPGAPARVRTAPVYG